MSSRYVVASYGTKIRPRLAKGRHSAAAAAGKLVVHQHHGPGADPGIRRVGPPPSDRHGNTARPSRSARNDCSSARARLRRQGAQQLWSMTVHCAIHGRTLRRSCPSANAQRDGIASLYRLGHPGCRASRNPPGPGHPTISKLDVESHDTDGVAARLGMI